MDKDNCFEIFSSNLRNFRESRKISRRELEKKSLVSERIIINLEKGKNWTQPETIEKICRELKITYDMLFMKNPDFSCPETVNQSSLRRVFGNNLIRFMYFRGQTQKDIAKATGIPLKSISDFATGASWTSLKRIAEIAEKLKAPVFTLFREFRISLPLEYEKLIYLKHTFEEKLLLSQELIECDDDGVFSDFQKK